MALISKKARSFTESVIREMTRLCDLYDGVNLAQGFPDFPILQSLKEAAKAAIDDDINQYAITWGAAGLRQAIAAKTRTCAGLHYDPEREITVTCGSTEAMVASLLATVDPGDEVVIFEPFYENYGPDTILCGAIPRYVSLYPPDWDFDRTAAASAFNEKTKAMILNSPHNPTGKVFDPEELMFLAELCRHWDVLAITDEIYEHILYDGAKHVSIAEVSAMHERSIIISGLSKSYGVTGWRIGYVLAPEHLTAAVRKVHDFLTVGAPAPLQKAGEAALAQSAEYYRRLSSSYEAKRDLMVKGLVETGFIPFVPRGAYYIMADIRPFGFQDDVAFSRFLVEELGVAVVPGSSFYSDPASGCQLVRFCFCKEEKTLLEAIHRLEPLKALVRGGSGSGRMARRPPHP